MNSWVDARCQDLWKRLLDRCPRADLTRIYGFLEVLSGRAPVPDAAAGQQLHPRLYVPDLTPGPWFDGKDLAPVKALEAFFPAILNEFSELTSSPSLFSPYGVASEIYRKASPILTANQATQETSEKTGSWQAFYFRQMSGTIPASALRCPETAKLMNSLKIAREALFSVLQPGTRIPPHSDQLNFVATCHLALSIPSGSGISVGGKPGRWIPGKCILFDGSFIHEAWNAGSSPRAVLLVDLWHPDLNAVEIQALTFLKPHLEELATHSMQR